MLTTCLAEGTHNSLIRGTAPHATLQLPFAFAAHCESGSSPAVSHRPLLSQFDSAEQLLALLPQQVWLLDDALKALFVPPELSRQCGVSMDTLSQQGWLAAIHPDDAQQVQQAFAQDVEHLSLDYRWRQAEGSYRWVLARARRLPGPRSAWLGTHTDIDARKNGELALSHNDSLWKLALESSGDGVWDWYVQAGIELYSPRCLQIYGYGEGDVQPTPEEFDARTHPDDLAQMQQDREDHFSGRKNSYRNEHRIQCKDGSWKWVLSRGMVISRDEQGQPLRMVGTHTDITARREQEAIVWRQSRHDALTGLPNRTLLRERLEAELRARSALPQPAPLAVLFVDLDHFKEVNDTLGHGAGDALLLQAAERIQACLGPKDVVGRMGGDEFTVLLGDVRSGEGAEHMAQQLIDSLARVFTLGHERVFVSASIGISLFPEHGQQIETLFKHADQALYVSKGAGRNRYSHFTPELQQAAQLRMRLATDLRGALAAGQLCLHYQPIVRLSDGSVSMAEALLRWQHPSLGDISPAVFIPIAESTGQIQQIGAWVFRTAQAQAEVWRRSLRADFQISVNTSPVEFRAPDRSARNGFASSSGALRWLDACLQVDAVSLEITEGLLLDNEPAVAQQLSSLRTAGIQISLDDFGTGYSSLAYLQQHAIDVIKIDKSFVHGIGPGSTGLALCKAIIAMAHEMGLRVVAEGVETELQASLLLKAGCDYGQGYWFSKALPADELAQWLNQGVAASSKH